MLIFTLAIPCLTISNLPWFMDLTFQVPTQYCSLWYWTSLSPPDTSTTGHNFFFGLAASLFPELLVYLRLFPSSMLGSYCVESSSFNVLSFCLFILFMVFSWQEYWSGLPFRPPVGHFFRTPD